MSWKILIERGNLGFSAAHFITIGGQCEPLHGHNYGVRVEVAGDLTPDSLLLDFVTLKDVVRALCKEWEHRFLLPLRNPHLAIRETPDGEWEIRADAHTRYLLPQSTVVPLPVDNATTERLAELLAHRLAETLERRGLISRALQDAGQIERLTVGVEETEMQTAFYTMTFPHRSPTDGPVS